MSVHSAANEHCEIAPCQCEMYFIEMHVGFQQRVFKCSVFVMSLVTIQHLFVLP